MTIWRVNAVSESRPQSRGARWAVRTVIVLVVVEAILYATCLLYEATRLGQGGSGSRIHASLAIGGLVLFSGERVGNRSTVDASGWVGPLLVGVPLAVAAIAYWLGRRTGAVSRPSPGSASQQ